MGCPNLLTNNKTKNCPNLTDAQQKHARPARSSNLLSKDCYYYYYYYFSTKKNIKRSITKEIKRG
jgi:hypothetical protein